MKRRTFIVPIARWAKVVKDAKIEPEELQRRRSESVCHPRSLNRDTSSES